MKVKHHSRPRTPAKKQWQRSAVDEQSEPGQRTGDGSQHRHLADTADTSLASEQRFRITFEQAPIGMAQVDLTGRWLLVNQRLCSLIGFTQQELLEHTFHAVMLEQDLSTAFAHAQSMITGELQTYQQEMRFVRKDSSQIWVNLTVTLIHDATGMPLYFLAVVEDLTDRRLVAQQRRLNELKDQFIINVNHELRTPLTQVYVSRLHLRRWCVMSSNISILRGRRQSGCILCSPSR